MVVRQLERRIVEKVVRIGEHEIWTGAKKLDGTGVMKVGGRVVTVGRVVWERAHGPLTENARVLACSEERACVRLDHLRLDRDRATTRRPRRKAAAGAGSKRRLRPGVWKLEVSISPGGGGSRRRAYRTVRADSAAEASRLLASFVTEVREAAPRAGGNGNSLTLDEAVERYLGHLRHEKGRADKTVDGYRLLHETWFAESIGGGRLAGFDVTTFDAVFGGMRAAGRSESRLRQAKALYSGLFRWAKARGLVERNPMADFEMPTSSYVSRERTPPEAEELALFLRTVAGQAPDVVRVLTLGATSCMRRGELVALRRSAVDWERFRNPCRSGGRRSRTPQAHEDPSRTGVRGGRRHDRHAAQALRGDGRTGGRPRCELGAGRLRVQSGAELLPPDAAGLRDATGCGGQRAPRHCG